MSVPRMQYLPYEGFSKWTVRGNRQGSQLNRAQVELTFLNVLAPSTPCIHAAATVSQSEGKARSLMALKAAVVGALSLALKRLR